MDETARARSFIARMPTLECGAEALPAVGCSGVDVKLDWDVGIRQVLGVGDRLVPEDV
jgi:hypothetical protein